MMNLDKKNEKLRGVLRDSGGLLLGFSGGLDSTLLAAVAHEELGGRFLAVTATSPLYPERELEEARRLAAAIGFRHLVVPSDELEVPGFAANPVNRCYLCKRALFGELRQIAEREGLPAIADGANLDDLADYRPGRQAAAELGVISPLIEAEMGKEDIRALSRRLGLPTAEKPSMACLASRFPFGTAISAEKLRAVETVEAELSRLGFSQFRARHHGEVVRIEVPPGELAVACQAGIRESLSRESRRAGFKFVALDLDGYRTGSLNP